MAIGNPVDYRSIVRLHRENCGGATSDSEFGRNERKRNARRNPAPDVKGRTSAINPCLDSSLAVSPGSGQRGGRIEEKGVGPGPLRDLQRYPLCWSLRDQLVHGREVYIIHMAPPPKLSLLLFGSKGVVFLYQLVAGNSTDLGFDNGIEKRHRG